MPPLENTNTPPTKDGKTKMANPLDQPLVRNARIPCWVTRTKQEVETVEGNSRNASTTIRPTFQDVSLN